MTKRFQHRYRIASARAQWWDYGWNGAYFVTIRTKDGECIFGEVIDADEPYVQLSEIGQIAHQYWQEIPDHFPFVELGEFIVMRNHVHGIVIIDRPGNEPKNTRWTIHRNGVPAGPPVETPNSGVSTHASGSTGASGSTESTKSTGLTGSNTGTMEPGITTPHDASPNSTPSFTRGAPSANDAPGELVNNTDRKNDRWKPGTLGVILNQYKRICTIDARKIRKDFAWQSRFHDRIIRNEEEFQRISDYIINNPSNWRDDKFYVR